MTDNIGTIIGFGSIVISIIDIINILIFVSVTILGFIAWTKGILPVLVRLGIGLAKRKIAIFANGEFSSLKNLLMDSNLFKEKNIIHIPSIKDIGSSTKATVYLVSWTDWQNNIDNILNKIEYGTALIIYAQPRTIPDDQMKKLDQNRNVVVSNFRGRLLNDIVISMITTGYEISFN